MSLPPSTPVRVTLRRAYRHGQTGRIEREFRESANPERWAKRERMYWVQFAEGAAGCFWESEVEVVDMRRRA